MSRRSVRFTLKPEVADGDCVPGDQAEQFSVGRREVAVIASRIFVVEFIKGKFWRFMAYGAVPRFESLA
jgi:hypothetical protein